MNRSPRPVRGAEWVVSSDVERVEKNIRVEPGARFSMNPEFLMNHVPDFDAQLFSVREGEYHTNRMNSGDSLQQALRCDTVGLPAKWT
jgi:hypothetical protein